MLIASGTAFAQIDSTPRVEDKQLTYHLLANLSYEMGVSKASTIRISGPIDAGVTYELYTDFQGSTQTNSYYYIRPSVAVEFRHYYNLENRMQKGKRVDKNSGNFLAPVVALYGPALAKSDGLEVADISGVIGGLWGIQRNYGKSFNFQLSIGPGFGFSKNEISFVPLGELSLGFRIGN
jgi:hypothetical protein